jgi:hypothetical protein
VAGGAGQVLAVDVLPGQLSVFPAYTTVTLQRDGGQLRGSLQGVVVTDARGSLQGWSLIATPVAPVGHPTHVDSHVVALSGVPGEASDAHVERLDKDPSELAVAGPGGGGGQFQISADFWTPSHGERTESITLRLEAR